MAEEVEEGCIACGITQIRFSNGRDTYEPYEIPLMDTPPRVQTFMPVCFTTLLALYPVDLLVRRYWMGPTLASLAQKNPM